MMTLDSMLQRYRVQEYPLRAERFAELSVVVAAVLLLLSFLMGLLVMAASGLTPVAPSEDSMQTKEVRQIATLEQADSDLLLARPVFWEERRPVDVLASAEVKEEPAVAKVEKLDGVEVRGVFGSADALGLIVVIDGKDKSRIAPGEKIKGWSVEGIRDGEVLLSNGARRATLVLETATPAVSIARQEEANTRASDGARDDGPADGASDTDLTQQELQALMQQAREQMRGRMNGQPRGSGKVSQQSKPPSKPPAAKEGGLTLGGYSTN